MSTLDHKLEPEVTTVRRLEVITEAGRRRRFTEGFKARVVEETLATGAVVSEVDRRHGLMPQQVFTWRRQARRAARRLCTANEVAAAMEAGPRKSFLNANVSDRSKSSAAAEC